MNPRNKIQNITTDQLFMKLVWQKRHGSLGGVRGRKESKLRRNVLLLGQLGYPSGKI